MTKLDPTRTTTLRAQYSADMKRRFKAIRRLIVEAIVGQDALGLKAGGPQAIFNSLITNGLPEKEAWRFLTDAQKLEAFQSWLQLQIDEQILEVDGTGAPWTAKYVDSAYRKGSIRAYNDVNADEVQKDMPFYAGKRAGFLESAFNQPERLSKVQFLHTRSYQDLKGITDHMSLQMGRIMADGLAHGKGARAIARDLAKGVDKITNTRALVMARTEVVAAHAEGQLDSFEELNVEEVGVYAEWSTAEDDRVCPLCRPMEGTVFKVSEARGMIPRHPNCRCAWIPANVGEEEPGNRFWGKKDKQSRINKSLKAELPKRTREGKTVPQTVREAERRSTWAGKEAKVGDPPDPEDRFVQRGKTKPKPEPAPRTPQRPPAAPKPKPKPEPTPAEKARQVAKDLAAEARRIDRDINYALAAYGSKEEAQKAAKELKASAKTARKLAKRLESPT